MDITKEIMKIIEYQNSILPQHKRKSKMAIDSIVDQVISDYKNRNYDFSKLEAFSLNQAGKKRNIRTYTEFSCEEILCIHLKRLLDRRFYITYPNRNKYIHSLFDLLSAVKDMNDFTIMKFDFEDFFNSISSTYVYDLCIKNSNLERDQKDLFYNFCQATKYTYAGLSTSNIIIEIITKRFDDLIRQILSKYGLIYYRRYIDDGILIFNKYIDYISCKSLIDKAINDTFLDYTVSSPVRCKTKLNLCKIRHISKRDLVVINPGSKEFDFLGYQFVMNLNNKKQVVIKYGITQKKIDKYNEKIDKLITSCNGEQGEYLRHCIRAYTQRTVYRQKKYNYEIWKVKGFIANYGELRYYVDKLTPDTEAFLKNMVKEGFSRTGMDIPYYLKGKEDENSYNLYNNLVKKRTLLFVEGIGISKETLETLCDEVDITDTAGKEYNGLVRDYLIRIKVGH